MTKRLLADEIFERENFLDNEEEDFQEHIKIWSQRKSMGLWDVDNNRRQARECNFFSFILLTCLVAMYIRDTDAMRLEIEQALELANETSDPVSSVIPENIDGSTNGTAGRNIRRGAPVSQPPAYPPPSFQTPPPLPPHASSSLRSSDPDPPPLPPSNVQSLLSPLGNSQPALPPLPPQQQKSLPAIPPSDSSLSSSTSKNSPYGNMFRVKVSDPISVGGQTDGWVSYSVNVSMKEDEKGRRKDVEVILTKSGNYK
jgi:hypothetical protein